MFSSDKCVNIYIFPEYLCTDIMLSTFSVYVRWSKLPKVTTQGYTFSKDRFGSQTQGCSNVSMSYTTYWPSTLWIFNSSHESWFLIWSFLLKYFKHFPGYELSLLVLLRSSKYYCFVVKNVPGMISIFWNIKIFSFV